MNTYFWKSVYSFLTVTTCLYVLMIPRAEHWDLKLGFLYLVEFNFTTFPPDLMRQITNPSSKEPSRYELRF